MPRAAGSILVALVAVLVIAPSAMAAKAERHDVTYTELRCDDLQSEAGHARVSVWSSDGGDAYADLAYWAAPANPEQSGPTWYGYSNTAVIADDGSTIDVSIDVYEDGPSDPSEEPYDLPFVGAATLAATLTTSGEAEAFRVPDRWGNHNYRATGSFQSYSVAGSLELPGALAFDLGACQASRIDQTQFSNQPNASVAHWSTLRLSCSWAFDDGLISLFASSDNFGSYSGLVIEGEHGFIYGDGETSLSRSGFDTSFDLYSGFDPEPNPIGSASASADLGSLERVNYTEPSGDGRFTAKGVQLAVTGELTLEIDSVTTVFAMDDSSCSAADVRFAELPSHQKRAEPVTNDTPETAIPLKLCRQADRVDGRCREAPEAPCLFDDGEGGTFEGPMTHTVWWRIEATGGSITVDTGGSTFDTLVAVYLVEDGAVGAQIACVDDVDESLQALVTFETVGDASYLVQAGGFGGETGDLALAIYEP